MESSKLNSFGQYGETIRTPTKRPENVIGFLREFNFGNPNESARVAVERFIEYIEKRHLINERLLPGEPKFLDLLIEKLEEAGFLYLDHEEVSRKKFTPKVKQALLKALKNFEKRSPKWQEKISKTHQDWRP